MKKIFLFATLVISSYGGFAAMPAFIAESNPEAMLPEPAPAATIVGKWRIVDMKFQVPAGQKAPKHSDILEMIEKQGMVYEFAADGTMTVSAKDHPAESGKYKKTGNKLITTMPDGKKDSIDIAKLTDKELHLKMMAEKMTIMLEKM